jgi:hypothetical protein
MEWNWIGCVGVGVGWLVGLVGAVSTCFCFDAVQASRSRFGRLPVCFSHCVALASVRVRSFRRGWLAAGGTEGGQGWRCERMICMGVAVGVGLVLLLLLQLQSWR